MWRTQRTMDTTTADLTLVRRTKLGDHHAFDMLMLRHQQKLARVVSRYHKLPQQIEDIVQEAFIKAYLGIMSFREDSRFSTWLHRIGVNTAIDFLAAERRRIPLDQPPIRVDTNEPIALEIVDENNPEQLLATQQINVMVTNALKKLPKELRLAITLREFDGLSYEEIAEIMGCPIGTVRSRIFRARENISAILRPQSD